MNVRPLLTWELHRDAFEPPDSSLYLYGVQAIEPRGGLSERWRSRQERRGVSFLGLDFDAGHIVFVPGADASSQRVLASDVDGLQSWFSGMVSSGVSCFVLDITSMPHSLWAPMVAAALDARAHLLAVYIEPATYTRSMSPAPGDLFDLSEKIEGIAPIPGFSRLPASSRERPVFVPLLGFEGARFAFVRESVQVDSDRTFPVIGVPGFQPEFPFYAYEGNRRELEAGLAGNVQFAKANCPFDVFFALADVADSFRGSRIRVAPIGTKPHALGAVLFALSGSADVELVYDHPLRSKNRSDGSARMCVYPLSQFASGLFPRTSSLRGVTSGD